MHLEEVIWIERFVEKLADKRGVDTWEVEEILFGESHVRKAQKGHVKGEDIYVAYGQAELQADTW